MDLKTFYLSPSASLDDLDFAIAEPFAMEHFVRGGLFGLPVGNILAMSGPRDMFRFAAQRVSDDGSHLLIASLMGSVSLPLGEVDASKPLGLVCEWDEDSADAVVLPTAPSKISRKWAGPVHVEADGKLFKIARPEVAKAVLDGSVAWVVFGEDGRFKRLS